MASKCGYTQYVKEHYTLEELEEIYQDTFKTYEDVYLPDSLNTYSRKVFYQFYDDFLNKILVETQAVFPDLSMEVRLDIDPVKRPDGTLEGVFHDATFTCGSSGFTSAMYSVAMGFESNGQELSAAQALAGTGQNLDRLSQAISHKTLRERIFRIIPAIFDFKRVSFAHREKRSGWVVLEVHSIRPVRGMCGNSRL